MATLNSRQLLRERSLANRCFSSAVRWQQQFPVKTDVGGASDSRRVGSKLNETDAPFSPAGEKVAEGRMRGLSRLSNLLLTCPSGILSPDKGRGAGCCPPHCPPINGCAPMLAALATLSTLPPSTVPFVPVPVSRRHQNVVRKCVLEQNHLHHPFFVIRKSASLTLITGIAIAGSKRVCHLPYFAQCKTLGCAVMVFCHLAPPPPP